MTRHGIAPDAVRQQMQYFQSGFPYADIVAPATLHSGVLPNPGTGYAQIYRTARDKYNIVKFVPASGAATRMFKDLFEFMTTGEINQITEKTLANLDKFAFYDELRDKLPQNATDQEIFEYILTERGLNYGNLPKALLAFHKYNDCTRTALEEHLVEGALYSTSNGVVKIHFTISPEHRAGFDALLEKTIPQYESMFGVKYDISMSEQKPQTDTIAVNPDNTPFRNDDGTLLFRPAGHGALIENLNDIDADLIFIKNIDNICTDKLRDITVTNKEILAGTAITIQNQIFDYMRALDSGNANPDEIRKFINDNLGIKLDAECNNANALRTILNRPLRVCGIIKNTGEPGGGPFWVRDENGTQSLQIVEPGQIAPENINILKHGEFFSPTDLVCAVRDYRGNKFNLIDFVDPNAGFISNKSKNGRPLRAMERPGLWNGAMAKWNTVFVEMPLETFTPVKTICDLLNETHNGQ